jgi:hypothetical protein
VVKSPLVDAVLISNKPLRPPRLAVADKTATPLGYTQARQSLLILVKAPGVSNASLVRSSAFVEKQAGLMPCARSIVPLQSL